MQLSFILKSMFEAYDSANHLPRGHIYWHFGNRPLQSYLSAVATYAVQWQHIHKYNIFIVCLLITSKHLFRQQVFLFSKVFGIFEFAVLCTPYNLTWVNSTGWWAVFSSALYASRVFGAVIFCMSIFLGSLYFEKVAVTVLKETSLLLSFIWE